MKKELKLDKKTLFENSNLSIRLPSTQMKDYKHARDTGKKLNKAIRKQMEKMARFSLSKKLGDREMSFSPN